MQITKIMIRQWNSRTLTTEILLYSNEKNTLSGEYVLQFNIYNIILKDKILF